LDFARGGEPTQGGGLAGVQAEHCDLNLAEGPAGGDG
jgi:hypothetical protein